MSLKKNEIARNVRVRFAPHYIPSSLGNYYLATQEEYLYVRDPMVMNDALGDYVYLTGGSDMNSGTGYLRDLELERPIERSPELVSKQHDVQVRVQYERLSGEIRRRLLQTPGNYVSFTYEMFKSNSSFLPVTGVAIESNGKLVMLGKGDTVYPFDPGIFGVLNLRVVLDRLEDEDGYLVPEERVRPGAEGAKYVPRFFYGERAGGTHFLVAAGLDSRSGDFQAYKHLKDPVYLHGKDVPQALRDAFFYETGMGYALIEIEPEKDARVLVYADK